MKGIVISIVVTAIAFTVLTMAVPQITYTGGPLALVVISALFGVANGLIKPLVKIVSLPVNLLTLGLFGLVINVVLFMGVAWVSDRWFQFGFTIAHWPTLPLTVDTLETALIGSLALSILTAIIGRVVHD
jgi:putative membrane protein